MESVVKIFEKEEFGSVRVVMQGDEPWFVAKDVCDCLELENVSEALRGLDDDEKITLSNPDGNPRGGIPYQMNVVSEPGLYSLILRSRKPEAKAFKRWVTHEVLPSIRKRGLYATEDVMNHILEDPDFGIALLQQYKFERERRKLAEMQRDEAVRTKAEIGSRREATSMATASVAVRQRDALADRLGEGKTWKQVKAIDWLGDVFDLTKVAYQQIGKALKRLSGEMDYPVQEVPDSEYDTVKRYHIDVIEQFKERLLVNPDYLAKYRK